MLLAFGPETHGPYLELGHVLFTSLLWVADMSTIDQFAENDNKLRAKYIEEGWGKLAVAAGFDPVDTESSARHAFRFCWDLMQKQQQGVGRCIDLGVDPYKDTFHSPGFSPLERVVEIDGDHIAPPTAATPRWMHEI